MLFLIGPIILVSVIVGTEPLAVFQPSGIPKGYGADFGSGLALSDDWLIIGAPGDFAAGEPGSGSAYVYRREGINWIEHQILFGEGWYEERFGASIAMDDDWLMITGPNFSTFCCNTGRVYVFRRDRNGTKKDLSDDSWKLFQIVNENLEQCCVGGPVALDNGVLVVGGARPEFNPDTESGRAFIYEWDGSTWAYKQTVWPSDPRARDAFGGAVAIRGSTIAIGAPYGWGVFIFQRTRDGWQEQFQLWSSDGLGVGLFGSSIAMSESTLVVGAPGLNGQRIDEGAAYVFVKSPGGWIERHKLVARESTEQYPNFGANVDLHGNLIVIAAYDKPWAYAFNLNAETCSQFKALHGTAGIRRPMKVRTDGRFVVARDHIYAAGPALDLADFASFQNCASEEKRQLTGGCPGLDWESDSLVDVQDLPFFLLAFSGPE